MRWRRHHDYVRPPRPKARVLTADERNKLLGALKAAIECSPILTTFAVQVQCLRNRFFLEWQWSPDDGPDQRSTHGRITPLADPSREFLLEVQRRKNSWSEVATGSPSKLISVVADDTKGTFHGLGSLEKSLRHSGGKRLPVRQNERGAFVYADTDQRCSVQEALYHYFNLPIHVIAQPGGWYSYLPDTAYPGILRGQNAGVGSIQRDELVGPSFWRDLPLPEPGGSLGRLHDSAKPER